MSVVVKICGITSPADAQMVAEAGANAIGLMFFPGSKRFVNIPRAVEIVRDLPPELARVGVFVDASADEISRAIGECGLNILQFHGQEPPEYCRQFGVMSMKAFRLRDESDIQRLSEYSTDAWLLDSYVPGEAGGTGARFNWDWAVKAKEFKRPFFLAGGLTPENVGEAVATVRPYGVDVSTGVESSPGKKDREKVRRFVDAVRREG